MVREETQITYLTMITNTNFLEFYRFLAKYMLIFSYPLNIIQILFCSFSDNKLTKLPDDYLGHRLSLVVYWLSMLGHTRHTPDKKKISDFKFT